MGNYDRYEKLAMLGDIDEKYIKEADRYLSQPLAAGAGADITPDSVMSLSPQPKKLSWKSFAVIAACAAVLIGGTVILANYLNGRTNTPPILDNSESYSESDSESRNESYNESDTSHEDSDPVIPTERDEEYLNEMRELFGAQGDIDYARDRLDIKTYTLPEDIKKGEFNSDIHDYENGRSPVVADKSHVIFVRANADGQEELTEYSLYTGTYTTLHSIADDKTAQSGDVLDIADICYADSSHIVIRCAVYRGATMSKCELRVIERKHDNGAYPWVSAYDLSDGLMVKNSIIIGDDVYFTAYDPETGGRSDNAPIMRYNMESGRAAEQVAVGVDLYSYNGELYYDSSIEGSMVPSYPLHRLGGELPYDTDKYGDENITIGKCGIYNATAGYDGIIRSCITDKVIVSGDSLSNIYAGAYDFLLRVYAGGIYAFYNTNTGELLVLEKDDPLNVQDYEMTLHEFDGGLYAYSIDDGEPITLYVVSEGSADTRIDQFKEDYDVSDNTPVTLFEDGWELQEFNIGDKDDRRSFSLQLDNRAAFLNERTALITRTGADGSPEIAAYDLSDKTFITLFDKDDETLTVPDGAQLEYFPVYSDNGIVVFQARITKDGELLNSELRVINISDNSKFGVPVSGTPKLFDFTIQVENNKLYFITASSDKEQFGYNGTLYSYDLSLKGAGSAERIRDNVYNIYSANGEIITSTLVGQTAVQEIDGTEVFHLPDGDFSSTGYSYPYSKNIFVMKNGGSFLIDEQRMTNIATGEKLFRVPPMSVSVLSDSCVLFGHEMVFDAKNNKLYDLKDHTRTQVFADITDYRAEWYKCGEGFCTFDITSGNGYIIKRRGMKIDKIPDPAQIPEQPLMDIRSHNIYAADAESIAQAFGAKTYDDMIVYADPDTVTPLYEADIYRYAEMGDFTVKPSYSFSYDQPLYIADALNESGEFIGKVEFDSDRIMRFFPAEDGGRFSLDYAANAKRIAALMGDRGIEPVCKEVKLVFINNVGYVYYIDCGNDRYLAASSVHSNCGNLFDSRNGGLVKIDDDLKTFAETFSPFDWVDFEVDNTPYM